ncbi:unnamed protein product [Paramecium pentaurelia]|uniref:Uncharacterized protein n=1 Tax=Paramecium pentaurelia TaxID=43138 RepID=A0A8S1X6Z6_9CILI|nr:unnamed protein product [Paramecium pentaurelia]
MGPCSSRKIQPTQSLHLNNMKTNIQGTSRMNQSNMLLLYQKDRIIQPYNPNSLQYQYNVDVEGVIFDVIAPPDLLEDDNLEPFEGEQ